ncbi:VOC family protein [Bradyrhizobium sp. HKCCYLS1011]|uniref:VOC family protein n=1 Tax=Bradyrhizobium sp. HKCCYLS1011 TaxID=3420733 RepID=UPI003EC035FE
MSKPFPSPVPEIPVRDVARAAVYYERCLGFNWDWGMEGIGQVSRDSCRLFLTDGAYREGTSPTAPVVIWINLNSKAEVDELHEAWSKSGARIVAAPESTPSNLHEFTAADLDGNQLRVFYDFAWELPDRGGRIDDTAQREAARGKA